tara:strand:+ start:102 stop:677 length:576 start_codon:yes stop_codon:yes gene_type:complete
MSPELIVFTGPMFGGKTSRLLAAIDRYQYQKRNILCFKPIVDDRYESNHIATHSGLKKDVVLVRSGEDITNVVNYLTGETEPEVIAVDETFMIPDVADNLIDLFMRGKTILVSSLQLSYEGKPFKEMQKLLPYATKIEVCPAVCVKCKRDAHYTHRKVEGNETLMVGGGDIYEPLCHKHYKKAGAMKRCQD